MGWTVGDVAKLGEYLQLFADADPTRKTTIEVGASVLSGRVVLDDASMKGQLESENVTAPPPVVSGTRDIAIPLMLEIIASKDAGTRRSLVERLGLRTGDLLTTRVWQAFASALSD